MVVGEKLNEGYKMYSELVDNAGPLTAWSYEFLDSLFGRSLLGRRILAFFLIFIQAAYIGVMMINRKVFNENTYISSFVFSLLFCFSYDAFTLTGELLGSFFLLLALNNMFGEVEFRTQRDETVFNLGVYISIASLFSFAYWIFLFFAIVSLIAFARLTLRRFLLLVFGFVLPHLLVLSITFLTDVLPDIWEYYYLANLSLDRRVIFGTSELLALAAVPVAYLAISLFMLQREARFSKYQSLLLQVMFVWIGFCMIYLLFCRNLRPQNLIIFIPGLTVLITHFLLSIRRRRLAEINGWLLLIGIATTSYLARYDNYPWVDYTKLQVVSNSGSGLKGKRLLVLDDDLSPFLSNRLATPYLNWRLTEEIFSRPDYYEHVTSVYHAFKIDPPDVVIDKRRYLQPFLDRIPEISRNYQRRGDMYVRITDN